MKANSKARMLSLISSGALVSSLAINAWAQQSALPQPVPSTPTNQTPPPTPAEAPAAQDASTPASAPAENSAPALGVQVNPAETANQNVGNAAAAEPLTPTPQDNPKKKGKKKRGKAARRTPKFDSDNAEADSWGDPWGDSQDELRAAGLSFRFLVQTHYQYTHVASSNNELEQYRAPEEQLAHSNDGWDVNRLFFRIAAQPSRYVSLKMITDFAEFKHGNPKTAVKQAFVDLAPLPKHIHLLAGVVKLPYSITELDPIAKYEFTSLGQANDLVKKLDFSGRDVGAELMVTPLAKPRYLRAVFGAYQGHSKDGNASVVGSVGGRVESSPIKQLRIGADFIEQPHSATYYEYFDISDKSLQANPTNPYAPISNRWLKGEAFSADVTFESYGLLFRTEAMYGTRIDARTAYGAGHFAAYWASLSYKFPVGSLRLQPGVRMEWLDTDTEHKNGLRRQITAGLGTYFAPNIRFLIDVTRTDVQDNTPIVSQPDPLPAVPYSALDNTRVTGQLQVVL